MRLNGVPFLLHRCPNSVTGSCDSGTISLRELDCCIVDSFRATIGTMY